MTIRRHLTKPSPAANASDGRPSKRSSGPEPLPAEAIEQELSAAPPLQLLTPIQAATLLAVSPRCLERWRMTGEGPQFVRLSAKTIRYTAEALQDFVEWGSRSNTAQR